jgi:hypothetical protein
MIKALKSKIMNAIPALLKFFVLIAIFLLASNANAFTSLSPVAGNQVQEKHWFQFEEPINNPTNEPSCKPLSKPMNNQLANQPMIYRLTRGNAEWRSTK